jgi:hypothetical protein
MHTEEEIVTCLRTLIVALGVAMLLPMAAQSADTSTQPSDTTATQSAETSAAPAKCLDAFTVYEHWSGC